MRGEQIYPSPNRVLITLFLLDAGMGILHLVFIGDPQWGPLFNLAHEENLPTWYSSFQFLLVSGSAGYCYLIEKKNNLGWLVVAACMLGLAIDETLQIHETLIDQIMLGDAGENLRHYFGATQDTDSLLWTVVFAPLIILAGTGLAVFYYSRLRNNRLLFQLSWLPLCLLALSAGLEYLEAKTLSSFAHDSMSRYELFTFIEEMAELIAASLLVWVHCQYATLKRVVKKATP